MEGVLSKDVLTCIFDFVPIYDLFVNCSLVNKRWRNIIFNINNVVWEARTLKELDIKCDYWENSLYELGRRTRACYLLKGTLVEEPDVLSILIYKGFPLRCVRRCLKQLFEKNYGNKYKTLLELAVSTGPKLNPKKFLGTKDEYNWGIYVTFLLKLVGFNMTSELRSDVSNFMLNLGLHLKNVWNIKIEFGNRWQIMYDKREENKYKVNRKKRVKKRKITTIDNDDEPYQYPSFTCCYYKAHTGFMIDLMELSKCPDINIEFYRRNTPCIKLIYNGYLFIFIHNTGDILININTPTFNIKEIWENVYNLLKNYILE